MRCIEPVKSLLWVFAWIGGNSYCNASQHIPRHDRAPWETFEKLLKGRK